MCCIFGHGGENEKLGHVEVQFMHLGFGREIWMWERFEVLYDSLDHVLSLRKCRQKSSRYQWNWSVHRKSGKIGGASKGVWKGRWPLSQETILECGILEAVCGSLSKRRYLTESSGMRLLILTSPALEKSVVSSAANYWHKCRHYGAYC